MFQNNLDFWEQNLVHVRNSVPNLFVFCANSVPKTKKIFVRNSVQILCLFCAKFGAKKHKYTRNTEKWFRKFFTRQEFLAQLFSNSGPESVRKWHRKQNFVWCKQAIRESKTGKIYNLVLCAASLHSPPQYMVNDCILMRRV